MPRRSKALEEVARLPVVGLALVPCEYASGLPREAWGDSQWFAGHISCVRMVGTRVGGFREQPAQAGTGAARTTDVLVCLANRATVDTTDAPTGKNTAPAGDIHPFA